MVHKFLTYLAPWVSPRMTHSPGCWEGTVRGSVKRVRLVDLLEKGYGENRYLLTRPDASNGDRETIQEERRELIMRAR